MKEPEENEIYDLFRVRLNNPGKNAFSDDSWDKMEQLLDKNPGRKKGMIWLYRVSTGIAAALLLFAMFYLLRPVTPVQQKIARSSNDQLKPAARAATESVKNQPEVSMDLQVKKLQPALFTLLPGRPMKKERPGLAQPRLKTITREVPGIDSVGTDALNLVVSDSKKIFADSVSSLFAGVLPANSSTKSINSVGPVGKMKITHSVSHQLALSVLAAPDVNNANRISNGGLLGTSLGLQFSIQLSKRISLSSGAFYAIKPYQTASATYKPQTPNWWASRFGGTGKPDQVAANCKVLDIPLNVNYQVFNKGGSKFSVGSGLSSYFMLSESYNFRFANPSVNSANFEINNRNRHILGLINLDAAYERKVNKRFGILIQPYLKLPITPIGFGQVDLRSTGIAAGLSWNINSAKAK